MDSKGDKGLRRKRPEVLQPEQLGILMHQIWIRMLAATINLDRLEGAR